MNKRDTRDLCRLAFSNATLGMALVTPSGRLVACNGAFRSLIGLPREAPRADADSVRVFACDDVRHAIGNALADGWAACTLAVESRPGERWAVHVAVLPATESGELLLLSEWRCVHGCTGVEQALHDSERRFRELQENLPVGIYRAGEDGTIETANPALVSMMGYGSFRELEDADLERVWLDPHARDELIRRLRAEGAVFGYTARLRRKDGAELIGSFDARGTFDDKGRLIYFDTIVQDMTERVRAQEELKRLARTDSLTGLCNRQHLMALLAAELDRASRYHHPLSFMILDLDHFKSINDSHGHLAGDKVLVTFGSIIRGMARSADFAGRYGGEEFCVGLPETTLAGALQVAERIREATANTSVELEAGGTARVTCSIGVAEVTSADVDQLIARADAALYEAKRLGRNRVVASGPR